MQEGAWELGILLPPERTLLLVVPQPPFIYERTVDSIATRQGLLELNKATREGLLELNKSQWWNRCRTKVNQGGANPFTQVDRIFGQGFKLACI